MREVDKDAYFKKIGYTPTSAQKLYHASDARFRMPCCGRRFGKSTMAGRDLQPKLFVPGRRFWIVGPDYSLGEKEFRVIWDDMIVRLQLGRDKRVKKAYNTRSGDMYIEFPWQTRVEVKSAKYPDSLVGEALDGVIMSEAAKHGQETWERFIRPALSDKRGFADFPTTPEGYNWFHALWSLGQDPTFKQYGSWRFPSWANDIVYPGGEHDDEIELLRRTVAPDYFDQEIAALFSAFVGKIYPEWDETVHLENHKFRPEWPNYIAFDWGYTNPLAAIEFQVSPDDTIHVWREHYLAYTTLPQHVAMLKGRDQPEGYHLDLGFGDAADPEAAEYMSQHLVPTIADPNAKTNWREGIDLVRGFMRLRDTGLVQDEYGTPIMVPAFLVDRSCTSTISEFNNYRSKAPVKGMNVPEMGQKMADHTLDAIRYGLVHLYRLGVSHHLNEVYSSGDFNELPEEGFVTSGKVF
jgi:hypothetical protein